MDSKSIQPIREQLLEVKTQIEAKVVTMRSELDSLDDERLRVDSALAALDGTQVSKSAGKPSAGKSRKKTTNPAPGKEDVIGFIHSILVHEGVVEAKRLKAAVESKAFEAGFNRMGLSLRFKEALADSQFVDTPAGVRLSDILLHEVNGASMTSQRQERRESK